MTQWSNPDPAMFLEDTLRRKKRLRRERRILRQQLKLFVKGGVLWNSNTETQRANSNFDHLSRRSQRGTFSPTSSSPS